MRVAVQCEAAGIMVCVSSYLRGRVLHPPALPAAWWSRRSWPAPLHWWRERGWPAESFPWVLQGCSFWGEEAFFFKCFMYVRKGFLYSCVILCVWQTGDCGDPPLCCSRPWWPGACSAEEREWLGLERTPQPLRGRGARNNPQRDGWG